MCFLAKNFNDISFGVLAIEEIEKNNYLKAQEYFNKAEENRLNFPNRETYHLYKLIIKKMIDKNIKIICMQYPVRRVKSLQEQLKEEQYYKKGCMALGLLACEPVRLFAFVMVQIYKQFYSLCCRVLQPLTHIFP